MKIKDAAAIIESYAPEAAAMQSDNSGLQAGDPENELSGVMLCVDVTEFVIEEALKKGANLIISHHPFLFSAVRKISRAVPKGKMIWDIIQNNLSVYSSHTCMDVAQNGLNAYLADQLALSDRRFLGDWAENFLKMQVSVPAPHFEEFRNALVSSGFIQSGTVMNMHALKSERTDVMPGDEAGLFEPEYIIFEGICLKSASAGLIDAIYRYHPQQNPSFSFSDTVSAGTSSGIGICGDLPEEVSSEEFIETAKKIFGCSSLRVSANYKGKMIKRAAVCSGSGAFLADSAGRNGADVFITSDTKMPDFLAACENDIILISPTHFESEYCFVSIINNILLGKIGDVPIYISEMCDTEVII